MKIKLEKTTMGETSCLKIFRDGKEEKNFNMKFLNIIRIAKIFPEFYNPKNGGEMLFRTVFRENDYYFTIPIKDEWEVSQKSSLEEIKTTIMGIKEKLDEIKLAKTVTTIEFTV